MIYNEELERTIDGICYLRKQTKGPFTDKERKNILKDLKMSLGMDIDLATMEVETEQNKIREVQTRVEIDEMAIYECRKCIGYLKQKQREKRPFWRRK